jgi:predicted aspartyl protease
LLGIGLALATAGAGAQVVAQPSPAPLIPRAEIDNTLQVEGDPLRARVTQSRLTVATFVNGQGPFRFLIDTGADRSVIGTALARQLGLAISGAAHVHHVAGDSVVSTVEIDSLRAGTNEVRGIHAPALPEEYLGAQGIMGIDALREQRISMDFDRRTITIQDPQRADRAAFIDGEVVVTGRRRKGQLILTALQLNQVSLDAVIDTGAQVTMGNSALLRKLFAGRHVPPAEIVDVTSVTGQVIKAQLIVVPEIRIASLIIQNVPIAFYDAPPFALFGLANRPALLLGNDVLESFRRITLDFRHRKIRFAPRKSRAASPYG